MHPSVRIALAGLAALTVGPAAPAVWIVDKAASRLGFKSTFAGMAVSGAFQRWDAQIAFDPKALAASKVMVSVDVASATTGDQGQDEALPTSDWFDAAHFPRATFTAANFKDLGGGRYQALGTLTLKGATRPVTLPFTLAIAGPSARVGGQTTLNRTAFGIGKGQFASAETVPFDVAVSVTLSAKRGK